MSPTRQRVLALYEGRVQGVGFRFTVVDLASDLPVTGYVMNLSDGTVELVAEGEEKQIQTLLSRVRASHLGRGIQRESLQWSPATGEYPRFGIRYS